MLLLHFECVCDQTLVFLPNEHIMGLCPSSTLVAWYKVIYIHTHMHVHTHTFKHIHTHTHIETHIHAHTHIDTQNVSPFKSQSLYRNYANIYCGLYRHIAISCHRLCPGFYTNVCQ